MTGTLDLTFVVTPALSAGLTYEPLVREDMEGVLRYPHSGRIVGTPTAQQEYTLTVVDTAGNEAQLTFALATVPAQRYAGGTAMTRTLPAARAADIHPDRAGRSSARRDVERDADRGAGHDDIHTNDD